jgi:hypothetical protein
MQETPDTPDERLQRRRVRRWKRRARILGPFLGVPLLLLTLSLSVDLIEYQPHEERDRLTDRPIRMTRKAIARPVPRPAASNPTLIDLPIPIGGDESGDAMSDSIDLELNVPSSGSIQPPISPYTLKGIPTSSARKRIADLR